MKLDWQGKELVFTKVDLHFVAIRLEDIFAEKNNKTLRQTLAHRRYNKFANKVMSQYGKYLDWPLGKFLVTLKRNGDNFYLEFLNKYGDLEYCQFFFEDEYFQNKMGLYIFSLSDRLHYIGRCLDTYKKRINQGYGKIHPKNCFIDGQATNCHLNSLIAENTENVQFFVYPMNSKTEIAKLEKLLIGKYLPKWNISR